MTVEELIKKLKKCPPKAPVCWDSNKMSYWFGESVDVEKTTKRDLLDGIFDEDGNLEDGLPDRMRSLVRLS